jgi:hypothetical protein
MKKRPILERVDRYLTANPLVQRIKVHVSDYSKMLEHCERDAENQPTYYGLPVQPIGKLPNVNGGMKNEH